jgi:Flp pilus assembly protein TadG
MNQKGQAMVEMALVIFLLVILIFGMTEFGRAMYTKNTLTNAARAGARVAVVTPASSYPTLTATNVACNSNGSSTPNSTVYDAVCKGIAGGGIKANTSTPPPSAIVSIGILNPAGTSQTSPATGYTITVTVQSSFDPVLALMRNMISSTLSGQASMRYE